MAAEAIAVLVLVQETADTVTSVVKAIEAVSDLLGAFKKQKDRTPELKQCIELAKTQIIEEIHKAELETRLNQLSASAEDWLFTLERIVGLAAAKASGKDVNPTLHDHYISILDTIKTLNEVKYYFEGSRPKPKTPEMLGMYCLCYSLIHSFHVAADTLYSIFTPGSITPDLSTGIEDINMSKSRVDVKVTDYKLFRKGQIVYHEIVHREPGGPTDHTGVWVVDFDGGRDSAIANMTGLKIKLEPAFNDKGKEIIENRFHASEFGGRALPLVFSKWNDLQAEVLQASKRLQLKNRQRTSNPKTSGVGGGY